MTSKNSQIAVIAGLDDNLYWMTFVQCHSSDDNSQTDTIYLNFIMIEIKPWNTADFEIRTAVSLTVRVQRKRVLIYEHGWFRGDRGTPLITHRQLLSVISCCYLYHTYCTSRISVTFPPLLHFYTYDSSVRLHFRSDVSISLHILLGTDSSLITCEAANDIKIKF